MISLRQQELAKWQHENFDKSDITAEWLALGMAEEVGELCHMLLKRKQGIREGKNGNQLKPEIADAFADTVIFGIQLMEYEGIDAEQALRATIEQVLKRKWKP